MKKIKRVSKPHHPTVHMHGGMTGSFAMSSSLIGPTGSVGHPGIAGQPGIYGKEILILCINDSGFFKQGEYYKVLLFDSGSSVHSPWRRITITSIDNSDSKTYKPDDFDRIFIYGDKLRDKKINEILNGAIL